MVKDKKNDPNLKLNETLIELNDEKWPNKMLDFETQNTSVWKPLSAVTFNKFKAIDVDVGCLLLAENNLFVQ